MINGLMLLKICDPEYASLVLTDFSMGMAIYSMISLVQTPISYVLLGRGTTIDNFLYMAATALLFLGVALFGRAMLRRASPDQYQ